MSDQTILKTITELKFSSWYCFYTERYSFKCKLKQLSPGLQPKLNPNKAGLRDKYSWYVTYLLTPPYLLYPPYPPYLPYPPYPPYPSYQPYLKSSPLKKIEGRLLSSVAAVLYQRNMPMPTFRSYLFQPTTQPGINTILVTKAFNKPLSHLP